MGETTTTSSDARSRKKKPLDPHLFAHADAGVDDVLVQTGYPVWNLISEWITSDYRDEAVLAAYSDMPREEWDAAKCYYLAHKIIFDARIIRATQPYADDDTPPLQNVEDYYAWLAMQRSADQQTGFETHG